jgi:hypothetical protein
MLGSGGDLPAEDVTVVGIHANPDAANLGRAAGLQADGVSRVHVQHTFALEQAPEALAAFAGGTLGKVVITTD